MGEKELNSEFEWNFDAFGSFGRKFCGQNRLKQMMVEKVISQDINGRSILRKPMRLRAAQRNGLPSLCPTWSGSGDVRSDMRVTHI